jgi:hypothetical protein
MVDREKVLVVLRRRFPGARPEEIAAANAIVGLAPEYRAIDVGEVLRLECRTIHASFDAGDVATGRMRLFLRT